MTFLKQCFFIALVLLLALNVAQAQTSTAEVTAQPTSAPLFFSEAWVVSKEDGQRPVTQADVATENLEFNIYGSAPKDQVMITRHPDREGYPTNLWTGFFTAPLGLTFRDQNNYVDMRGLAKVSILSRVSGFHELRPLIKLADGTWLVGDMTAGMREKFVASEISFADLEWLEINIERVVTIGNPVEDVDLSKVDEIGVVDLLPGSGQHGPGGWFNFARIDVYGVSVKR